MLLHGFPECWYSWRHQLTALAEAGYHAVAPDQRGYCRTGGPAAADQYTMLHLTGDVIALLDALGEPRAVVAGHDWGAPVAWHTALLRPDRVRGVIGLSVPYRPRGSSAPIASMRAAIGDGFYMVYFQQPGVADAELARDPRQTFTRVLYGASGDAPRGLPVVPPGGGFLDMCAEPPRRGPARVADQRRHRRLRRRVPERRLHRAAQLVPQPGPQLGADRRLAPRPGHRSRPCSWPATATWSSAFSGGPGACCPGCATAPRRCASRCCWSGCGHWTQQERPDDVSQAMIGFIRELD